MNYENGLIVVNGVTDSAEPVWNPDKGIQQMVDNWELYRTNYIHGVEEYDKLYNMPPNADYLDIDSEEEEEDEDAGEEAD